jgi:hypothetical protein
MSVLLSPYKRLLSPADETQFNAKTFQGIERELRNESRRRSEPVRQCAVFSGPLQACHGTSVIVGREEGLLTPLATGQLRLAGNLHKEVTYLNCDVEY